MTEKIKTLEEGKALLAEYKKLSSLSSLEAGINWDGYDRLPDYKFTCVCGYFRTYPMGIDDLERTIAKGWDWKLEHHTEKCFGHDEPDEPDEDEEEEEEA